MEIRIPYGRSFKNVILPDTLDVDILEAPDFPALTNPQEAVHASLDNLLGEVDWSQFSGVKSVGIAINDKTRPVPHPYLLPPLLMRLAALGIPEAAVKFYVAVGTHAPMSPDEIPDILPLDILNRYHVVSHDSEDIDKLMCLGATSRGTMVWSNKDYVKSELKIVVGNIEPHQFVGFSGGVKSAAIGLSGLTTINQNHALMVHPNSRLGRYAMNPARQDVEEIGQMIGVHLAHNAILNQHKQIVDVLTGDPLAVMKAGVPRSRQVCQVAVTGDYALVIASPGGHPKDLNVYQAQKGLAHAALVTRPDGTIILIAACPEGAGSSHYEDWMLGKRSYDEIIQKFKAEGFRIGPHKAYQIARDASTIRLMFYSEMDVGLARGLLLNPVEDLQVTLDQALADLNPGERVGILPHASSTIPFKKGLRGAI